jgi:hypothetical protein
MARFDWETEEEVGDINLLSAPIPARRRRRQRVWLFVVTLFILVALVTYWQLNRKVEARADLVEQEVTSAFELWTEAVVREDVDILNTLLVGSEAVWASGQRRMLSSGITLDRKMLGISLRDRDSDDYFSDSTINLAPDWQAADITFESTYDLAESRSDRSAVQLQHAVSFRRVNGRWFLAKLNDGFWGEWKKETGNLLSIEFRQRDEEFAVRLKRDLEAAMVDACARLSDNGLCPGKAHLELRLDSDPRVLAGLTDPDVPLLDGRTFLLPSPTVVGTPVDQEGYEALYGAFATRILEPFVATLNTPIALPREKLKILCYQRFDSVPRLYQYDVSANSWSLDLDDRTFRFLSASADDSELLLQEYFPGRSANRLRMAYVSGGVERIVFDESYSRLTSLPVGWGGTAEQPELLLFGYGSSPESGHLGHISLDDCHQPDCGVQELEGFPIWSPDKQRTIVTQGETLYLGDDRGQNLEEIGEGFSAFWLDNERYGYARYIGRSTGYGAELVMASVDSNVVRILLQPHDLAQLLHPEKSDLAFVDFVSVSPSDRKLLVISARSYFGELNRSYIFSARLAGEGGDHASKIALDDLTLRLTLDGLPRGYPGQLA